MNKKLFNITVKNLGAVTFIKIWPFNNATEFSQAISRLHHKTEKFALLIFFPVLANTVFSYPSYPCLFYSILFSQIGVKCQYVDVRFRTRKTLLVKC